ncbi:SPOR domain-containing protein [Ideonella sp. B508-1]|uniref:SPOR domain-containing protein n=1 Tax=Ideonella sp. B508-1 TaxID=137716 RepID=UPI000347A713|nr:SPOR domain-containing protein [Ideonella sp. B508-1]
MLRALLIALVLANLAVWAWRQPAVAHALSLPGPDSQRAPDRLSRQINPQAVRLVHASATAPAPSPSAAPAALPASAASAPLNSACLQAGPLSDTALAPAVAQLQALGLTNGQWQDGRQESGGRWIVVMGPYKTPDQLQKKQQELRGLKIAADELVNHPRLSPGLSLGQFASPTEAQARLAQVSRQGAHSARVEVLVPARVAHLLRVTSLSAEQVSRLSAPGDGPRWQACDATP